jgi:hypothetical protein
MMNRGVAASITPASRPKIHCHTQRKPLNRGCGMAVPGVNDR